MINKFLFNQYFKKQFIKSLNKFQKFKIIFYLFLQQFLVYDLNLLDSSNNLCLTNHLVLPAIFINIFISFISLLLPLFIIFNLVQLNLNLRMIINFLNCQFLFKFLIKILFIKIYSVNLLRMSSLLAINNLKLNSLFYFYYKYLLFNF